MLHDGVRDRRRSHGLRRGGKPSILPVPSGTLESHPSYRCPRTPFATSAVFRLCTPSTRIFASRTLSMSASTDHPLTGALRIRDADAPQLGTGIVDKIFAAFRPGFSIVPTGTSSVKGAKWRLLVDEARLTPEETANFFVWLEEAHGAEVSTRAQLPPRQLEVPSLPSRAAAGDVKQEEAQVPLREQYGATAGHGWSPGPSSSYCCCSSLGAYNSARAARPLAEE